MDPKRDPKIDEKSTWTRLGRSRPQDLRSEGPGHPKMHAKCNELPKMTSRIIVLGIKSHSVHQSTNQRLPADRGAGDKGEWRTGRALFQLFDAFASAWCGLFGAFFGCSNRNFSILWVLDLRSRGAPVGRAHVSLLPNSEAWHAKSFRGIGCLWICSPPPPPRRRARRGRAAPAGSR